MSALIDIQDISKIYETGSFTVHALKNVSLKIKEGEFVSLVGPSGSGKSTLLHVLGFLDRPDSGDYHFAGSSTAKLSEGRLAAIRSGMIGFIFQSFHLLKRTTAKDNVLLPMVYSGLGTNSQKALKCLDLVGLTDRAKHKSNELSGGQCQRVAIARALINDPLVILADEPTGNLDAVSRQEVMKTLRELNEKGMTVIIVTHDDEICAQTKRIIRMKDGEIIADENREERDSSKAVAPVAHDTRLPKARFGFTPSEIAEQFKVAFKSIWNHKMRSALTVLGIFIGVGSIISLMTISEGFMKNLLSGAGEESAKKIWVGPKRSYLKSSKKLTYADVAAIKSCPLAEKVVPIIHGNAKISAGKKHVDASVQSMEGWTPEDRKKNKYLLDNRKIIGRFFTKEEENAMAKVVVINQALSKKLFGDKNPVNTDIRVKNIKFNVIGLVEDAQAEQLFGGRPTLYMPLQTAAKRVFGRSKLSFIEVSAASPEYTIEARKQIIMALRKIHPSRDDEDYFDVKTFEVQVRQFKSLMQQISLMVYGIAGISLLVGGIGIMNIMLVSVTERTREIGLRKALGAKKSDILGQFLIEAVVLCLLGGLLGIGFGVGTAWIAYIFIKVQPALGIGTVSFAFGFSSIIGISFGFWPAMRAASLDPIEALRYE